MKKLFTLTFLLFAIASFSQKPNIVFGKVDMTELKRNIYPIDSSAEAIVLYEKNKMEFGYLEHLGPYIESKIHIRKKIIKSSAKELGIIKLICFSNYDKVEESISDFEGQTYYIQNGNLVINKISQKDLTYENLSENRKSYKANLLNVNEGCIIEYSYTKKTPLQVRSSPSTWDFQGPYPTLWSEVEISVPNFIYFKMHLGGYLPLALNNKTEIQNIEVGHSLLNTDGINYNFAVKNAPAFVNENYITTETDFISKIDFELSQIAWPNEPIRTYSLSWEDVDTYFCNSEFWGSNLRKRSKFLDDYLSKFENIPNNKDKIEKIYYDLQKTLKFSEVTCANCVDPLNKVFDKKLGNSSELNMLLIMALQKFDFEANPVLISTRSNGRINTERPTRIGFNSTICHVKFNNITYLLDISDKFNKFGVLPFQSLNHAGRLIKKCKGEFISLTPTEKYKGFQSVNYEVNAKNGNIEGKMVNLFMGYKSHEMNESYKNIGNAKSFSDNYIKDLSTLKITNLELKNFSDPKSNPEISFDFKIDGNNQELDILYLPIFLINDFNENPFKQKKRNLPIDFGYATDIVSNYIITVPNDFKVESMPKNLSLSLANKGALYIFNCEFNEATNKISTQARIQIKSDFFMPELYDDLKEFYARIIQKQEEFIVLKRK